MTEYEYKTLSIFLLGLLPLYVGMIKKSTIVTVVSSIAIVAIASNSQGSGTGLLLIPDFVAVPSAEIMQTIGVVSLIVGICLF